MTQPTTKQDSSATSGEAAKWITVPSSAVEWLMKYKRASCEKAGLCSDKGVIRTAATPAPQAATTEQAGAFDIESLVGRTVSVDVSTCDDNAGHRIFAELTGETGSDGTTLLAIETERNFEHASPAATTASASGEVVSLDDAWDSVDWDQWRSQPIRELVRHLHSLTSRAPSPSREAAVPMDGAKIFDIAAPYFAWNAESWHKATQGTIGMPALLSYTRAVIDAALVGREAAPLDERRGFEQYMTKRGEAVSYEGDGLYAYKHVNDQADAFRAGVEFSRAALAQPAAPVVDRERELADALQRRNDSAHREREKMMAYIRNLETALWKMGEPGEAALASIRDGANAAAAPVVDGEMPPLPLPDCTYADHSYPAYSRKAVEKLRSDYAACVAAARSAPVGQHAAQADLLAQCRRARNLIEAKKPEAALTCLQDAIDAAAPSHPEPAGGAA